MRTEKEAQRMSNNEFLRELRGWVALATAIIALIVAILT